MHIGIGRTGTVGVHAHRDWPYSLGRKLADKIRVVTSPRVQLPGNRRRSRTEVILRKLPWRDFLTSEDSAFCVGKNGGGSRAEEQDAAPRILRNVEYFLRIFQKGSQMSCDSQNFSKFLRFLKNSENF